MLFLFFLVVSACFWLMQALNETISIEVRVPLVLRRVPSDVLITTPLPSEATIQIQDRGISELRQLLHPVLDTVYLDFTRLQTTSPAARVCILQKDIQPSVLAQLSSTARMVSIVSPDTIDFYYSRGVSRKMPLLFTGALNTADHHVLESCRLSPDSVEVYAPEQLLRTMSCATAGDSLVISNLRHSGHHELTLTPPRGAHYEPSHVTLHYDVAALSRHTIRVPVKQQNFPGGKSLRTFPSDVTITYWAKHDDNAHITPDSFYVTVTYAEVINSKDKLVPKVHAKPRSVTEISITPREEDYLIEDIDSED